MKTIELCSIMPHSMRVVGTLHRPNRTHWKRTVVPREECKSILYSGERLDSLRFEREHVFYHKMLQALIDTCEANELTHQDARLRVFGVGVLLDETRPRAAGDSRRGYSIRFCFVLRMGCRLVSGEDDRECAILTRTRVLECVRTVPSPNRVLETTKSSRERTVAPSEGPSASRLLSLNSLVGAWERGRRLSARGSSVRSRACAGTTTSVERVRNIHCDPNRRLHSNARSSATTGGAGRARRWRCSRSRWTRS